MGSIAYFAGQSSAPNGWVLCDGSAVSRETYSALFDAVGTTYGTGDGSTTFNVPNLVDKFVEGSATAGTVKSAGLPNITGAFFARKWAGGTDVIYTSSNSGAFYDGGNTSATDSISANSTKEANDIIQFNASRSSSVYGNSTTVQPPALTMKPFIYTGKTSQYKWLRTA